jgi:hypothetical protein
VFTTRSLNAAIVYQRSVWINGGLGEGGPQAVTEATSQFHLLRIQFQAGKTSNSAQIAGKVGGSVRSPNSDPGRSLLSEKYKQGVSNNFHEGAAEKEFGGKANDTEGNDDHEKKKDNSAEFRHSVDHSSVAVLALTNGGCRQIKNRSGLPNATVI